MQVSIVREAPLNYLRASATVILVKAPKLNLAKINDLCVASLIAGVPSKPVLNRHWIRNKRLCFLAIFAVICGGLK